MSFEIQFEHVLQLVNKSSKNITRSNIKNNIRKLRETWKAQSYDFSKRFGYKTARIIDDDLSSLENLSRRSHFLKSDALDIMRHAEKILRECKLKIIATTGSDLETEQKDMVLNYLSKNKFDSVLIFLRDAEGELLKPDYPEVCHQLRLGLEEYLRVCRERKTGKKNLGGLVGDHLKALANFLDRGDVRFICGFHGFLSEKGSHSTQSRKNCDLDDAKFALKINYLTIEFLNTKFF